MSESLSPYPELPFREGIVLDENIDMCRVLESGQPTAVLREPFAYDAGKDWDDVLERIDLLEELEQFGIKKVAYLPFVTKFHDGRDVVAMVARYVEGQTLDEALDSSPQETQPKVEELVARLAAYYEDRFIHGMPHIIDIEPLHQYMVVEGEVILVDIDAYRSYSIEDLREEGGAEEDELELFEKISASAGEKGVNRAGLLDSVDFLINHHGAIISQDLLSRLKRLQKDINGYIGYVLRQSE